MKKNDSISKKEREFLWESNCIENERSQEALEDAERAWLYARTLIKGVISVFNVLKIHELLMKRLNPRIAGRFRSRDVWIGGECKEYRGREFLLSQLEDIINSINKSFNFKTFTKEGREETARYEHVRFEDIHPFEDGNGRTGRILWNVNRKKLGLPLGIIHEGEEQMQYYKWFEK
jgi:Fic family protein